MLNKFLILIAALILPWSVSSVMAQNMNKAEQKAVVEPGHEGHDHGIKTEPEVVVDQTGHEGHDHSTGEDSAQEVNVEQSTGLTIQLTPEAVKLAEITISKVMPGLIGKTIELPGEIGFNEDRLVDIAPRFAGIAMKANYKVGDYVQKGNVVAVIESNESLNSYSINAPISGWVIERHISFGEYVNEENSIYVIADLSTVWVNLAVYPKDANQIKKGQIANIEAVGSEHTTKGLIEFVSPIMDLRTRNATARITLPNKDNSWRPGTFVQASISTETGVESLVVDKNAIQYLDEKSVIFVSDGPNRFTPVEIVTGESDTIHTQVLSGLAQGTEYVSNGAFELKAKIITSNLEAHAGHGH